MAVTDNDMISTKLQRRFRKGRDLEMHISFTRIEGLEFVELRDYIPSQDEYGKGYLFPSRMLTEVLEVLAEMDRYNSTAGARPGEGQLAFPGMGT